MEGHIAKSPINERLLQMAATWHTVLAVVVLGFVAGTPSASANAADSTNIPAWVFPIIAEVPAHPIFDDVKLLHVPRSKVSYTQARLNDFFNVPDWHPTSHSAMRIVTKNLSIVSMIDAAAFAVSLPQ